MKKVFSNIFLLILALWSYSIANWNMNFQVSDNSDTWLLLEWESYENSGLYRIDYWTNSGSLDMTQDFISWNIYWFKDLEGWEKYYFTITAYDDWWEEAYTSDILEVEAFDLDSALSQSSETLYVESSEMIDSNKVKLKFSNPPKEQDNSERKFRVEAINDSNDYYEVEDSYISENDPFALILTLDRGFEVGVEYKVVVLSISDIHDNNIEFWVDSESVFEWIKIQDWNQESIEPETEDSNQANDGSDSDQTLVDQEIDLNSAWDEPINNNNNNTSNNNNGSNVSSNEWGQVELNAAGEEVNTTSNGWEEVDEDTINSNLINVADSNEKLPQTWPTQTFIVLFSLLFWAFIFYNRFKK